MPRDQSPLILQITWQSWRTVEDRLIGGIVTLALWCGHFVTPQVRLIVVVLLLLLLTALAWHIVGEHVSSMALACLAVLGAAALLGFPRAAGDWGSGVVGVSVARPRIVPLLASRSPPREGTILVC